MSFVYTMTRTPGLLPGTLDLLILRASSRFRETSCRSTKARSIRPSIVSSQGWIEAEWKVSEPGRRAKYYHLTASGRRQLAVEAREWERMANAIGRVMKFA
jgi:PadR family transcriptional regulator, regulatory protein PadR